MAGMDKCANCGEIFEDVNSFGVCNSCRLAKYESKMCELLEPSTSLRIPNTLANLKHRIKVLEQENNALRCNIRTDYVKYYRDEFYRNLRLKKENKELRKALKGGE